MPLNIEEIKAALPFGGARPTLFEVYFSAPVAINRGGDFSRVSFLCKSTQIPQSTIGTIPVPYKGRVSKFAGDREFSSWSCVIINDEDFAIRSGLESWSSAMNEHQGNIRSRGALGNPYSYKADISIIQYSKNGFPVRAYTIVGAQPQDIGAIELSAETTNTLEEYTVTWDYDYWTSIDTDGASPSNFAGGLLR